MNGQEQRVPGGPSGSRAADTALFAVAGVFITVFALHLAHGVFLDHLPFRRSHLLFTALLAAAVAAAAAGFVLYALRRKERALRRSETHLRAMSENLLTGVCILQDGAVRYVNPAAARILGCTVEELRGADPLAFVHPEDRDRAARNLRRHFAGEPAPAECSLRCVGKEGKARDIELMTVRVEYDGSPAVMGNFVDVTGRRQMEDSLVREHEFTRALLDNMADAVVACDANGMLVLFNRTACEWHGKDAQALPSSEWAGRFDLYEADGKTPMAQDSIPLARALNGEYVVNTPMTIAAAGRPLRHVLASARPFFDTRGKKLGAVVVMTDISDRKRTEEELRRNESFLDKVVDNLPNMVFVKDARELRFVRLNKAAEGIIGYSRESLLGRNDYDFFPREEADHFVRKDREVLESGKLLDIPEENILTKDRGERILHTRKIPLFDEKGAPQFLLGISEDITERKQLEAQRMSMEKLKSLGLLAGGIAHDFNNLLSIIMGNISYAGNLASREKWAASLADALKACRRARSLTQQLLTFAIGDEPVKKTVSIDELLRQTVKLFLSGSSIEPRFSLMDPWPVEIDVDQIYQVIQNLVVNARDAMPNGGVLEVSSRNVIEKGERFLSICIRDNGEGMPPEVLDRIFDPYFSTKKAGTGLGLTIAYSIIQKHKGSIAVESRPGVGTAFTLLLPASEAAAPEEVRVPLTVRAPVRGKRILILDDEEGIREMLENALTSLGHFAASASNGEDTLRLFSEAARAGAPFDLVIMDLTIPGRKGGKDIIGDVFDICPGVKTIVSSGYSDDPVMANYRSYGFHAILKKPYEIEELDDVLNRLLG